MCVRKSGKPWTSQFMELFWPCQHCYSRYQHIPLCVCVLKHQLITNKTENTVDFFFLSWGNNVLDWCVFKFLLINSVFHNFWKFRSHQPRVCPAGQASEHSVTFLGEKHSQQVYRLLLLLFVWKSVGIPGAEPRRGTNRYLWCCPGPECHHSWTAFTCSRSVTPTATGCIPVVLEMDWISVLGACAQSNNNLCHVHFNQVKKVVSYTAAKSVDNFMYIFFFLSWSCWKDFLLFPFVLSGR